MYTKEPNHIADSRPQPPQDALSKLIAQEQLSPSYRIVVTQHLEPLAQKLATLRSAQAQPLIIGINGAQGTGKSTLALFLKHVLEKDHDLPSEVLSIDDLYLSQPERDKLAHRIHPLMKTRGVPGTHHVEKGITLLKNMRAGKSVMLPRFNKSTDNPSPQSDWPTLTQKPEIILFEGWCIAARPQSGPQLTEPINILEAAEDPEGLWRRYVNDQLATNYADLFAEIDLLIHLKAPSFECIYEWRKEQEEKLTQKSDPKASGVMDENALERFIMHYERLTRWMLSEMQDRADFTISLNTDHSINAVKELNQETRSNHE